MEREAVRNPSQCGYGGGGRIRRLIYGLKPESISLYWVFTQNQHLLRDCQN